MEAQIIDIRTIPEKVDDITFIENQLKAKILASTHEKIDFRLIKKSLDARSRQPIFNLRYEVALGNVLSPEPVYLDGFQSVENSPAVIIVGAGPAGYFAALELIQLGIKPIVLDRGKDVRTRRRDLRAIQQFGIVDPDSNYCFGEGGAGTYSDGKLYTRSHKRGDIYKVLKLFVEHGASADILIDAHPHIGTNKLPQIVGNMRATIEHFGGQVLFGKTVIDIQLSKERSFMGVICADGSLFEGDGCILATGHSARDIYALLHHKGIEIEAKPFALGIRVEHPQALIDEIQYKRKERGPYLPPSSYSLVCQVADRGVFSFCMCPGGLIVPAATAPGEIVVNGMSPSKRDSPFSNSGMVVAIEIDDLKQYKKDGVFASMAFQRDVEQNVFNAGDGSQKGPAVRLTDFVNRKVSSTLPSTSYIPGIYPAPIYDLLPDFVSDRLVEGLKIFGKKMKGYLTSEAIAVATESRTSAPIKIPRDPINLMHPSTPGLFPCGEGAGYAGGIVSAAMDGIRVAQKVNEYVLR
jgi:uncharacterized FAD-dependent dehydrogenase